MFRDGIPLGNNKTERLRVGEAMTREWGFELLYPPSVSQQEVAGAPDDAELKVSCEDVPKATARALVDDRKDEEG